MDSFNNLKKNVYITLYIKLDHEGLNYQMSESFGEFWKNIEEKEEEKSRFNAFYETDFYKLLPAVVQDKFKIC